MGDQAVGLPGSDGSNRARGGLPALVALPVPLPLPSLPLPEEAILLLLGSTAPKLVCSGGAVLDPDPVWICACACA